MIKRLDHVHVVAKDMDASIEFYTKALGFRLLRRVRFGPGGERQLSYVGLGDMMIELVQPAHDGEFQGTEARPIGLAVDDLDEAVARFKDERRRGGERARARLLVRRTSGRDTRPQRPRD